MRSSSSSCKVRVDPNRMLLELIVVVEQLHGYDPGEEVDEDVLSFIEALHDMLPGVRLFEQLQPVSTLSHQDIADFIGAKGVQYHARRPGRRQS